MPAKTNDEPQDDAPVAGAEDLQAKVDDAHEKGYWGEKVDPTPDSEYTLQGQAAKTKSE